MVKLLHLYCLSIPGRKQTWQFIHLFPTMEKMGLQPDGKFPPVSEVWEYQAI